MKDLNTKLFKSNDVRKAVKGKEFILHYQPSIDGINGSIVGAEALVRWKHPRFGILAPSYFISILEQTSLIEPLGEWILYQASNQFQEWNQKHNVNLRIAVNFSERQLKSRNFVDDVIKTIHKAGLDPESLEIELKEDIALEGIPDLLNKMIELKNIGIHFSLDDFGIRSSSLDYLRKFPVDKVKIDKSFIDEIEYDPKNYAICEFLINMCQKLNIKVLAEGVENATQFSILKEMGCDFYQGYYFARPLNEERFEQLLSHDLLLA